MRSEEERPDWTDVPLADRPASRRRRGDADLDVTQEIPVEDDTSDKMVELREERLVPRKEMVDVGEVEIRKVIEEVPGRLEVEAFNEEVEIEHVPVGQAVSEKVAPWEEDGAMVFPVYEEQLVVTKRLVMKEKLLIRRVSATEKRLFTDTLRHEKLVVEDPSGTGLVHERHPVPGEAQAEDEGREETADEEGGILHNIMRRALS